MIIGREKDTRVSDKVINTQPDTIIYYVKHKPMYKKTSQITRLLKNP